MSMKNNDSRGGFPTDMVSVMRKSHLSAGALHRK